MHNGTTRWLTEDELKPLDIEEAHRCEPGAQALVIWGLLPLALVACFALIAVFA
jgi:hypothetical protein